MDSIFMKKKLKILEFQVFLDIFLVPQNKPSKVTFYPRITLDNGLLIN
jgi:hypothetical protein